MLINLTNHPSGQWGDYQYNEAVRQFGGVIDLEFPYIPPSADENYIAETAKNCLQKCEEILAACKEQINAVHIMGEFTFVFQMILLLQKNNILCVASTSERISYEENERKITIFEFQKFRRYTDSRK